MRSQAGSRGAVLAGSRSVQGCRMFRRGGTALIYIPAGVDPGTMFTGRTLLERALALAAAADLAPRVIRCATPPDHQHDDGTAAAAGGPLDASAGPLVLL